MSTFPSGLENVNCAESRQGLGLGVGLGDNESEVCFLPKWPLPSSSLPAEEKGQQAVAHVGTVLWALCSLGPRLVSGAGGGWPAFVPSGRVGHTGSYVCEVLTRQGMATGSPWKGTEMLWSGRQ